MLLKLPGLTISLLVLICGSPSLGYAATVDVPASILFFPRVVADGVSDTMIQISNNSNMPAYASCTYIRATSDGATRTWDDRNFFIELRPRQPTHWVVSRGREDDPGDPRCRGDARTNTLLVSDCDGAGFDPGHIQAVPEGFVGSVRCVEVDRMRSPWSGNSLLGTATTINEVTNEVTKYNAIGLRGFDSNDGDAVLCAGGEPRDGCPLGGEYHSCPLSWEFLHRSDSSPEDAAQVSTSVTLAPCYTDLAVGIPTDIDLTLVLTSELEQQLSISASVQLFADVSLYDLNLAFGREVLGGEVLRTTISATNDEGFLVIGRTRQTTGAAGENVNSAASIAHRSPRASDPSGLILLGEGEIR